MKELTGATDAVEAWKHFFEPGDVVGHQGRSQRPAGSPFVVRDRSRGDREAAGAGVKTRRHLRLRPLSPASSWTPATRRSFPTASAGAAWTRSRTSSQIDFPDFRDDPIAGFDHDAFVWMDLVPYGDDPKDDRKYRSHLGKLVTKTLNKIVAIPVLKDHGSAGVTGALKNMSHGTVNNVARSHSNSFANVCNQFIPQVITHPVIRQKFVLHIMDGIRGVYHGGPFSREHGKWTWENNAILFATDPVALDHIEWDLIDAQRAKKNLPPVAASGNKAMDPLKTEGFDVRQPQHIALAGALGMGYFDFKSTKGRRFSIQHRVVNV